jgi:hypothetical protein
MSLVTNALCVVNPSQSSPGGTHTCNLARETSASNVAIVACTYGQDVDSLSAEHTIFSVAESGPKMSLGER